MSCIPLTTDQLLLFKDLDRKKKKKKKKPEQKCKMMDFGNTLKQAYFDILKVPGACTELINIIPAFL